MRTLNAKDIVTKRTKHLKDGWATLKNGQVESVVGYSTKELQKDNQEIVSVKWLKGCAGGDNVCKCS